MKTLFKSLVLAGACFLSAAPVQAQTNPVKKPSLTVLAIDVSLKKNA